ncbi:hypothetical protein GH714_039648 [Hevea brasiliensis]|uniref:Lipoxygenase domain-containing protein n=1 Tax=Hevea brasiliensis TaxID=3981 RepID=A0A6A6MZ68_HEVBR|nr:hypothetical protein GH714_039648 [Hevea brasiliensis]
MALLKLENGQSINTIANFAGKALALSNENVEWILDSRASDHMTYHKDVLTYETPLSCTSPVQIPDGKFVSATSHGTVPLRSTIVLKNVLHIPTFTCNLISISKLTNSLNCVAHFFPTFCVLQGLATRKLIGKGELRNGLYYFREVQTPVASVASGGALLSLWHQRLVMTTDNDPAIEPVTTLDPSSPVNESNQEPIVPRPTQTRVLPTHLRDFHIDLPGHNTGLYSNSTDQSSSTIQKQEEPSTYRKAVKHPQWQEAMKLELEALEQNNTWTLQQLPPAKTAIGCKWVYKIKYKSDGSVERYMTRLITKGCTQIEGLDYIETFASVAKLITSYLPSETPDGLRRLREEELIILRGDGQGERKKDPPSESRDGDFYAPCDEEFSEVKELTFSVKSLDSVLHAVVPSLETSIIDSDLGFPYFAAIDSLFSEGINLPNLKGQTWKDILPNLIKTIADEALGLLQFETPATMDSNEEKLN